MPRFPNPSRPQCHKPKYSSGRTSFHLFRDLITPPLDNTTRPFITLPNHSSSGLDWHSLSDILYVAHNNLETHSSKQDQELTRSGTDSNLLLSQTIYIHQNVIPKAREGFWRGPSTFLSTLSLPQIPYIPNNKDSRKPTRFASPSHPAKYNRSKKSAANSSSVPNPRTSVSRVQFVYQPRP